MRVLLALAVGGVTTACASGGAAREAASARCAPIVADSLLGGVPVYPECGVTRVVRASDPSLATAMLAALPSLRYLPATRDGVAVAQLTTIGWTMTLQAVPAALAPARRATRPRC